MRNHWFSTGFKMEICSQRKDRKWRNFSFDGNAHALWNPLLAGSSCVLVHCLNRLRSMIVRTAVVEGVIYLWGYRIVWGYRIAWIAPSTSLALSERCSRKKGTESGLHACMHAWLASWNYGSVYVRPADALSTCDCQLLSLASRESECLLHHKTWNRT